MSEAGSGRKSGDGPFTVHGYVAASHCSSQGQGGLELGVAGCPHLIVLLLTLITHHHLSLTVLAQCRRRVLGHHQRVSECGEFRELIKAFTIAVVSCASRMEA